MAAYSIRTHMRTDTFIIQSPTLRKYITFLPDPCSIGFFKSAINGFHIWHLFLSGWGSRLYLNFVALGMTASCAFLQQSRTRQLLCVKSLNWHCNIMPCSLNREFIFKCSAYTTCENIQCDHFYESEIKTLCWS